ADAPIAPPPGAFDGGRADGGDPNDPDGDGFTTDDCDEKSASINPGAVEIPGDGIDNDCNGKVDEAATDCDVGLALASSDAFDFAKSIGLCDKATGRKWGVVSAALETSDGSGAPLARQYGIQSAWGPSVSAQVGQTMAALSSGVARTPGQPDFVALPK